jgi:integrase
VSSRRQRGYLFQKRGVWFLRYYADELRGDAIVRVQRAHRLGELKTKTAARALADEFISTHNDGGAVVTLRQFVEATYLPAVQEQKRASTYRGYCNLWTCYVRPHSNIVLREFRTADADRILSVIARQFDLSILTLRHVKAFLSGVFRFARRQGVISTDNPVHEAALPRGKPPAQTHAYSLREIYGMVRVLPEPLATLIATVAFTGVRKGELRGLRWEDWRDDEIVISRSAWRGIIDRPKTQKSIAPVPLMPQLAARLRAYRQDRIDRQLPVDGFIFPGKRKKPINLDALARDVMAPILRAHDIEWHGWHAFRRGLATNLHQLGVQDKIIQRILRHANVAVTQACYILTSDTDAVAAIRELDGRVAELNPFRTGE